MQESEPGTTMESVHPEDAAADAFTGHSGAMSSSELWQEILSRLNQVQDNKITLEQAVEDLGMIVRDSFSEGSKADMEAGRQSGAVSLASVAHAPSAVSSQELTPVVSGADLEPEVAQRVVDALLGIDLSIAIDPEPEVMAHASAASGQPEQPSDDADSDRPAGTIADLSSEAIDSLLVTEFGEMTEDVGILDALLGDVFVPNPPVIKPPAGSGPPPAGSPAVVTPQDTTSARSQVPPQSPAVTPLETGAAPAGATPPSAPARSTDEVAGPSGFTAPVTPAPLPSKESETAETAQDEEHSSSMYTRSDLPEFSPGSPFSTTAPAPEPQDQPQFTSAASMATEILAANPGDSHSENGQNPDEAARPVSENVSEDFTFLAKNRKRRFRVH